MSGTKSPLNVTMFSLTVEHMRSAPSLFVEELQQPDGSYKTGRTMWRAIDFDPPKDGPSLFDLCARRVDWLILRYRGETWCLGEVVMAPGNGGVIAVYRSAVLGEQTFYRVKMTNAIGRVLSGPNNYGQICLDIVREAFGIWYSPDDLECLVI